MPPTNFKNNETHSPPVNNQPHILEYITKTEEVYTFDISTETCSQYGFFHGDRVQTPRGPATIIGIHDYHVWFHIDGDRGASFWDGYRSYEQLLGLGISLIIESPIILQEEIRIGEYRVKRIEHMQKQVNIMLQNENGPCPLIAIANILSLRGAIQLEPSNSSAITVDQVVKIITNFLREKYPNISPEEFDTYTKVLSDFKIGLDVNFGFKNCNDFETNQKTKIFDLLEIRMVHGWLVDPNFKDEYEALGSLFIDDVMLKLVQLAEREHKQHPSSPNTNEQPQTTTSEKQEKPSDKIQFTPEQGKIVDNFLKSTSHQLTEYGLAKLRETLKQDELVVFFRNNHFSTLIKHNGLLYNLVTDIGYERERLVVWDLLDSVDGDSQLLDGNFISMKEVHKQEVINTAILYGFSQPSIDEAIKECTKPNEEINLDKVLNWLNLHCNQ